MVKKTFKIKDTEYLIEESEIPLIKALEEIRKELREIKNKI